MAECIVCKANYAPGELCQRCGSDNSAWEEWIRKEEDIGAPKALLNFMAPYLGLPLMIAGWSLAFGLLGMLWPWGGVKPSVLILVIALTFVGCLLAVPNAYGNRFGLREQELLRSVKRGQKKGIDLQMQVLLVPVIVFSLAVFLTLFMVQSRMIWEVVDWLVLEDAAPLEAPLPNEMGFRERVERALPLACLNGYVTLAAFAYSSSLMLAHEYISKLNRRLPQPIFLREGLLVEIVQREAQRIVHGAPRVIGGRERLADTERGSRKWTWSGMERTDDGGIRLEAIVRTGSQDGKSQTGEQMEHFTYTTYEVEADPWSRITRVTRKEEPQ